jgi:hypothetical protein
MVSRRSSRKFSDVLGRVGSQSFVLEAHADQKLVISKQGISNTNMVKLDSGEGQERVVQLNLVLMALIELYGKQEIIKFINSVVPYDSIKDKEI